MNYCNNLRCRCYRKGIEVLSRIQIYTPDIKDGQKIFGDNILVQLYINKEHLPGDVIRNGDGWKIIFYKSIDHIKTTETPEPVNILKSFPVRWEYNEEPDYPCWEESWDYVDMSEINENEELNDRYFNEYTSYPKTKIGGYASYLNQLTN